MKANVCNLFFSFCDKKLTISNNPLLKKIMIEANYLSTFMY